MFALYASTTGNGKNPQKWNGVYVFAKHRLAREEKREEYRSTMNNTTDESGVKLISKE